MKTKEVLFIVVILVSGIQAATFYSLVDTQNDENVLEDSIELVIEPEADQKIPENDTFTLKKAIELVFEQEAADEENDPESDAGASETAMIFIDQDAVVDIKKAESDADALENSINLKLVMLERQNEAILEQFNDLAEKNRKLQEKLDEKRNKHHNTKRQKPAKVQLEENPQYYDNSEDWGFWGWLWHVTKHVARGFLDIFGIHF